jgi:Fe-S-cluster-containing dehydrogenase component/CRP-like cAMP-binding protein
MSTTEVVVRRPQRWDAPFCDRMTDQIVDGMLSISPFSEMDPSRFPRSCSLRNILKNDARLVTLLEGDIVVREGDYGNSAFIILDGSMRVVLDALPQRWLGRPQRSRKSLLKMAVRQLFGTAAPEVREVGTMELDRAVGWRHDGESTRVFLQDVPGVLGKYNTLELKPGEIFGELAAMARSPRTATVIAREESLVLEIRWQGLRDLMRNDMALRERIDQLYRQNSLDTHLRDTPLLAKVPIASIGDIATATRFETYGRFDWNSPFRQTREKDVSNHIHAEPLIAEEGDYVDGLVMIRSGFARLSRQYGDGHRTISYLGKGQTFGFAELSYNWSKGEQVPLLSSLRAVGYVDVLRVPTAQVESHVLPTLSSRTLRRLVETVQQQLDAPGPRESIGAITQKEGFESGLWEFLLDHRFINGTQSMLINTDRCTRCDDCIRACAATHDHNPRFVREGTQFGNTMIANACMQCLDPVCMIGCPTGAIARDAASGNVLINDQTCIGCSTCANSCPYSNIKMVEIRSPGGQFITDSVTQQPLVRATKCDLCVDNWGGPACQRACPHDALVRIDVSDNQSILRWLRDNQ